VRNFVKINTLNPRIVTTLVWIIFLTIPKIPLIIVHMRTKFCVYVCVCLLPCTNKKINADPFVIFIRNLSQMKISNYILY